MRSTKFNTLILTSKRKIKGGTNPLLVANGFSTLHFIARDAVVRAYMPQ